jgi:hypothetical protein
VSLGQTMNEAGALAGAIQDRAEKNDQD